MGRDDDIDPTSVHAAPSDGPPPSRRPVLTVGVGASAGGLESLERLFSQVPDDAGFGFVVVQHLSPHHPTMMVELLARRTGLDVRTAAHGAAVRRDTVHVLPPGKRVGIEGGRLVLEDQPRDRLNLPVDAFFSSLARDAGPEAVAIVLSGTGADGTQGIAEVRERGGLVLAETGITAQFSGMPDSAVASGHVNRSLAPEEMAEALSERLRERRGDATPADASADVGSILALLHERHGIDFAQYKPATVARRIERRMQLRGDASGDAEAYLARLHEEPEELEELYHDMLIGVTRFFRDAACFERIEFEVLPRLLTGLAPGQPLRAWSAGCASGGEAYSLAILVQERLEASGDAREAKIFATDLHRGALATAIEGVYAPEQLEHVSERRLARYFEPHARGHRVRDEVRRHVVFAPHNLLADAPFARLDLVVCRNLLIYFEQAAQRRVLRLLHFALVEGGALVLGPSEALGPIEPDYAIVDDKCRVFRKTGAATLAGGPRFEPPTRVPGPSGVPSGAVARSPPSAQAGVDAELLQAYDALLDRHMPPSVLLDGRDRVVDSYAGASAVLRHPDRRPDADLFGVLDVDGSVPLREAVERARDGRRRTSLRRVSLRDGRGRELVRDLRIEPVGGAGSRFVLVSFAEPVPPGAGTDGAAGGAGAEGASGASPATVPGPREVRADGAGASGPDAAGPGDGDGEVAELRMRVEALRERLQRTTELADAGAEELQATNEELVSSNEELQSSNEELNSVNEELHSVNAEYQGKIVELRELNEDMNHLLASTDIGTVFVDRELNIRRYTAGIERAYALHPSDVGRSLESFACRLDVPDLGERMREVVAAGVGHEREVRDRDGRALLLRLLPYELAGQIAGLVMTLIDIGLLDDARAALADSEARLRRRVAELQILYRTAPAGLCFFDRELRYVRANERMAEIDGVALADYAGRRVDEVLPEALAARLEPILRRVLDTGEPLVDNVIPARTAAHPDETRDYVVNYYPVRDPAAGPVGVSCVIIEMPAEPDRADGAKDGTDEGEAPSEPEGGDAR